MKRGKSGGDTFLHSDNFIYGTEQLFRLLTFVINSMLIHGVTPDSLLMSILVPIPKDRRGNLSSIDNYRAIAISDLLSKILENIIVDSHIDFLHTSDLQFGFKVNSSTSMCSTLLIESIQFYTERKSPLYVLYIDASKAFDRLCHSDLFLLLLKRRFCPVTLRLLFFIYRNQHIKVKWNNVYSKTVDIDNGVRQGGVISPLLFNVYIDNLFKKLKASELGCYINDTYVGALGYADDLALLAPSFTALKRMVIIISCHQTIFFHFSTHSFAVSLNFRRSSKVQGRVRREHCNMCAVFSVASPHKPVLSRFRHLQVSHGLL